MYPYGNDMKVFVSTTRLSKTSPYRLVRVMTEMFGGGVSPEEVGVDNVDIASFIILERLCDFVDEILSHDVNSVAWILVH